MVREDKARVSEGMRKGLKLEAKVRAAVVGKCASGDLNAFLLLICWVRKGKGELNALLSVVSALSPIVPFASLSFLLSVY